VVELSDDVNKAKLLRLEPAELESYAVSDPAEWEEIKPSCVFKKKEELAEGEKTVNEVARESAVEVSLVAAARLAAALLRLSRGAARLAGGPPTANEGLAVSTRPVSTEAFVVGDFLVIDTTSTPRFDDRFTLKEDYDFTAQHLSEYGRVLRCNKLCLEFRHYVSRPRL